MSRKLIEHVALLAQGVKGEVPEGLHHKASTTSQTHHPRRELLLKCSRCQRIWRSTERK